MAEYTQNNVTALNQNFQSNDVTNLKPYDALEVNAQMKQAREEALASNLAGEPLVPQLLKVPEEKPNLDDSTVTSSFTTRDQVMSKIGLMDENYNYTDTYTNYISRGGQVPEGYEYAHQELLDQERYDQIFEKQSNGELSYDQALMEAYGKDIMATSFGIDLTSVAYWKNKFLNDDFSNPFSNRYLMDQVKQAAEEYHKARQAGQFAHSQAQTAMTAASLLGEELEAEQVKDLFGDIDKYAEEQSVSDTTLLKQINANQIPASMRMLQIDDNTWAFLHTDGKLHKLEKGTNIKFDENGQPTEISLNGNDIIDFGDHFGASFAQVFRGVEKLATFATAIDGIWNGEGYIENMASDMASIDAFWNDLDWNVLGRLDHYDLDGFKWEAKDIFMAVGDISGMVAGSAALAGMGSFLSTQGTALAANGTTMGKIAGTAEGMLGRTMLRSTGWFNGAGGATALGGRVTGQAAHWINTAFKATPILAMKDFQQTVTAMNATNINAMLQGQDKVYKEEDMYARAFGMAAFSWVTNTILSSNIDSSFSERWGIKNYKTMNEVNNIALQQAQEAITKEAKTEALQSILTKQTNYLRLDNFIDMINTIAGNEVQNYLTTTRRDSNGKITKVTLNEYFNGYDDGDTEIGALWSRPDFWKNIVQTGVMQFKEYRKGKAQMLSGYNAAAQSLREANELIIKDFDKRIAKASKPEDIEALKLVKQQYVNDVANADNGDVFEKRIVTAMDKLCEHIGDGKNAPEIVKNAINSAVNTKKRDFYAETLQYMESSLKARKEVMENFYTQAAGDGKLLKRKFAQFKADLANKSKGIKDAQVDIAKFEMGQQYAAQAAEDKMYKDFQEDIGMLHTAEKRDEANINIDFKDSINVWATSSSFRKNKDIMNKLAQNNLDKDCVVIYQIKQEAQGGEGFSPRVKQSIFKTSMDLLAEKPDKGIVKLDDNTYALSTLTGTYNQAMTFEQMTTLNTATYQFQNNEPIQGAENLMGAFFGDKGAGSNSEAYDAFNAYLETAVKNKALTDLQAADAMHILMNNNSKNLTYLRNTLNDAVKNMQPGTTEFNRASKPMQTLVYLEAIANVDNYIGKKKIGNNTNMMKSLNIIRTAKGDGTFTISPQTQDVLDMLRATGRWNDDLDRRFKEAIKTEGDAKVPVEWDIIGKLEDSSSDAPGKKDNSRTGRVAKVLSASEQKGGKFKAQAIEELNKAQEQLKDFNNTTVEHNSSGQYLILDLANPAGEKTYQNIRRNREIERSRQEGYHVKIESIPGVSTEFVDRVELARAKGSSLIKFDLDNPEDIQDFVAIANDLGMFDKNRPLQATTKEEVVGRLKDLKNNWDNSITFSEGTKKYLKTSVQEELSNVDIDLHLLDLVEYKDGKEQPYDYAKDFLSKVQLLKIPKSAKKKRTGILNLLPFGDKQEGTVEIGESFGTGIAKPKLGTIAGKGIGSDVEQIVDVLSDVYSMDPDASTYMYLRNVIEQADPETFMFSYHYNKGEKKQLIDRLTKAHIINTDDAFYEVLSGTRDNTLRIALKQNQQEKMLNYLDTSKDFNLFRVLPLFSDSQIKKPSNYIMAANADGEISFVDYDGNERTTLIPDMYNGSDVIQQTGLQQLLNISLEYDYNSSTKARVLGELFATQAEGSLDYDPFHGNKTVDTSVRKQVLEAYANNDTETLTKLLNDYSDKDYEVKMISKMMEMENAYISDTDDEAYKLFYNDSDIAKRLLKAKQNGEDISSNNQILKDEIKAMYLKAHNNTYNTENVGVSYGGSSYTNPRYSPTDSLYATPDVLRKLTSSDYYLDYDESNPESIKLFEQSLDKALDSFNAIATNETLANYLDSPNRFTLFKQNNVSRCLQGLSGNDGYIPIEDCEYWANLTDAELNKISEALGDKMSLESLQKVRADATNAFNKYKNFIGEDRQPHLYKQYSNLGVSMAIEGKQNLVTTGKDIGPITKEIMSYEDPKEYNDKYIKLYDDTVDELNDKYTGLLNGDDFRASILRHQDNEIRERAYSPQWAEMLNTENILAFDQQAEILDKTMKTLETDLTLPKPTNDVDVKSKMTNDMYYSAMQFTREKSGQLLKVYDLKTGDNILTTKAYDEDGNIVETINSGLSFNGKNYFEVYNSLSDIDLKDGDSLEFMMLNPHPIDTYDGISYKHMTLTKDNMNELKNYYLGKAFETYLNSNRSTYGSYDMMQFKNHLLSLQENHPARFDEVMTDMVRQQVDKMTLKRQVIANLKTMQLFEGKTAQYINNAITPSLLGSTEYDNEAINNYLKGVKSSLDSDNIREQVQAAMITHGVHKSLLTTEDVKALQKEASSLVKDLNLSDDQLDSINKISHMTFGSEEYNKKLRSIRETYPELKGEDFLKAYIAFGDNPEVLALKTSGVGITDLRNRRWDDVALTVTTDKGKEQIQLLDFANDGRTKVDFDIEGIVPIEEDKIYNTNTLKDIFQVHMTIEDPEGNIEDKTYFIKHGDMSAKEYAEAMHLDTNKYSSNEGYKEAVELYKKEFSTDPNVTWISEEEFGNILKQYSNTTFMAFNGENYDFNYIRPFIQGKNNMTLDAAEFDNIIYGGDSISRRKLEVLTKEMSTFQGTTHNATTDTHNQREWRIERANSYSDSFKEAKQKMVTVADSILEEFDVEPDKRNKVIENLDKEIKTYYDNNGFRTRFVEGLPTGPESTYIQRQLNHLRMDNMGYLLHNIASNPEFLDFTGMKKFEGSLSKNNVNNIVDHIVGLSIEQNISPDKALQRLFKNDELNPELFQDRWAELANTPTEYEHTEDFNKLKQDIMNNPDALISKQAYDNVKKYEPTNKYLYAIGDFLNNFKDVDEDILSTIRDGSTTFLSSTESGVEQFGKPFKYHVNNKNAKKLLAFQELQDVKGEVATTREGTYKKIFGMAPTEAADMQGLKWNQFKRKFERSDTPVTLDASTIIMDRRRINDLLGQNFADYMDDDGNLYVMTLRQPSANKLQTEYFKVIPVEGDKGMAWVTPSVWRTKFAGDYDGDNITNFSISNPFERKIASFESNNMYLGDTIQEELYSFLNTKLKDPTVPNHLVFSLQLSKNKAVIDIAKEIDKQLSDTSISDGELNEKFRNVIKPIAEEYLARDKDYDKLFNTEKFDSFVDDIIKDIGVKTSNGHRHIDVVDILNDENSISAKSRNDIILDSASIKTNVADSIFGFHKQRFMTHALEVEHMEDMPLTKMDISPTYVADELLSYIDSVEWTKKNISDYYDVIQTQINKYINSHDISDDTIQNLFKAELSKDSFISLVEDQPDKAQALKTLTRNAFMNIDEALKYDTVLNKKYSDILKDSDNYPASYVNDLERRKNIINTINSIKGDNTYVRGAGTTSSREDDIVASSLSEGYGTNANITFVKKLNDLLPDNKASVLIFEGAPLNGIEDGLWINNTSKIRSITGIQEIDLDKYKENGELPESISKFIKEGTLNLEAIRRDKEQDLTTLKKLDESKKISKGERATLKGIKKQRLAFYNKVLSLNDGVDVKILNANDNSFTYIVSESLAGTKGYAIGKGMIDNISVVDGYKDFDIAMNAAQLSRFDKLGQFPMFDVNKMEEVTVKVKTSNGVVEKKARVLKNVPFNLLASNDKTTRNHPQKLDLMTLAAMGNSFTAHGALGKAVLNSDGDNIKYSNSFLADPILEANSSGKISWRNGADVVQLTRALALGKVMNEENLWKEYSDSIKKDFGVDSNINSFSDYQQAIKEINPTSKKMQSAILYLTRFLDKQGYSIEAIRNNHLSETDRKFFTPEIEEYFSTKSQGSVIDNNASITSKGKAKENLFDKTAFFIGNVYNPGEHNASRNVNIMSDEFYYIPMNEVYKTINGYYPSNKDILKGTADELFSYGKHYAGEVGDRFVPKDIKYATQANTDMIQDEVMNSLKNGQINGAADANWISNQRGAAFKNSGDTPIKAEDRSKGAYYQALAKQALDNFTITRGERAGAMLKDLIFSPDEVTGLIRASNKNISEDIVMNMLTDRWSSQEGQPILTIQQNTKKGTYGYLTGKGNDFITSNMNFYTIKDIQNKNKVPTEININDAQIPEISTPIDKKAMAQAYGIIADAFAINSKATNKFTQYLDMDRLSDTQMRTEFTKGADNVDVFKSTPLDYLMTSQGIHIGKEDRGDTIGVSMALENAYGEAQMIEANANEILFNLQKATKGYTPQEFENFVTYVALSDAESSGENISTYLTAFGIDRNYYETTMKQDYERLNNVPQISKAFNDFLDNKIESQRVLSRIYNEPFGNLMTFLTPYTSTKNKEMAYSKIKNNLHAALNFNEYNVIDGHGKIKSNMMFNFWEANKTMNREMAKLIGEHQVTEVLHQRGLLDNIDTTNKIQEYLSSDNIDVNKLYIKKDYLDSEDYAFVHNTIIDIIRRNTDVDVYAITRAEKDSLGQLKLLYSKLNEDTNEMLNNIPEGYPTDYVGLKDAIVNSPYDENTPMLQKTYDYMTARILTAQRLAELNPAIMTNMENYFNSVYDSGKVFVNKWGQKLDINSYVSPIGDTSTRWLVDNLEIASNNQNQTKWNQFLMEKALRGELYVMNKDLADQLEQKHFTQKTPPKIIAKLSQISKMSAGIQMAMPAKMLGRLFRFTGTDIMLGGTYSPYVYSNLGRAGKELSAALYSKGATVKEGTDLYDYIMREGQPLNATGKDPVTYSEDLNSKASKVIDFFTSPLAVQNHVGRYAIWLTAKESFDNDDPWYGPTYYLHKQVDNLPDNRDKATFIMDNMIGSPGGFPYLSKKTNGLMMFTTFPMNLTRTAGGYGMSVGTLFQEGITSENAPQWMKTIAAPSCTAIVAAYLGNLLISYVCDKYGVDEETEKKWQEEGVTIDPLGTMLGGTPSVVYDSLNPAYQLKEMYVNPWTNEYNKTFGDKALGFLNQNVLSKLNPAIKIPLEIYYQKDLMGSSPFDTSANYSRYENGIRKILGFFVGSGVANSVVDQYKIDSHADDSNFLSSMWKGFAKGFSNDLGNQKSWKKDISNYYNVIDSLKNYSYSANSGTFIYDDAAYDDLMNGKYMADHRNYTKGYGDVDQEDYQRVNNQLKKMINSRTDPTTVYAYIADEWNNGVSEATLRKALNNNSLARRLNTLYGGATKAGYIRTLSENDLLALEKALKWEEETYPLLKDFFPDASYTKKVYYKKPYYRNTSSGTNYPRSYRPSTPKYYPSNGYGNKKYKTKGPSASIKRVEVKVSPEMAVWNQDYNKTKDLVNWKDTDYKRVKPLNHGGGK